MGQITGLNAAIDGIPCISEFNLEIFDQDNAVACSNTAGGVLRTSANKDWSGVVLGFGSLPPKLPGELFTFTGADSAGQGWVSEASGAIVDRAVIFCNTKLSQLFYYYLFILGNGSLTPTGSLTITSSTIPNPDSVSGLGITIGSTAITDIGSWKLELIGNTAKPIWPGSASGWAKRGAGNIDAILTWEQYFNAVADVQVVNAVAEYKPYVSASTFWDLKWMQVSKVPPKYVVRNAQNEPEYVVAECEARFTGYSGGVKGYIKKPGGATYW